MNMENIDDESQRGKFPSLHERENSAACMNPDCEIYGNWNIVDKWNTRPQETMLILRVEKLENAIDLALGRLRQRRIFLNAMIPAAAEETLATAERMLLQCLPLDDGWMEKKP